MNDIDILQTIKDIEEFDDYCKENPITSKPPSNFSLMMGGVKDNIALNFLYSSGLDHMIDKFMDLIISGGSIEEILSSDGLFSSMMSKMGFDSSQIFKGKISQTLIRHIDSVIDTKKFKNTKLKLIKVLRVVSAMKKGIKEFPDKESKEKYKEAINSIVNVIKFVGKIYKNRKLVNERVQKGLSLLLTENNVEIVDELCILESFN